MPSTVFNYKNGKLTTNGIQLEELVKQYSTPLYVYNNDYIIDNYKSDFFNYINSDGLSLGLQSKDDIESEINEMIKSLCDLFSGFTIMGAEDLYPEEGDNPWENPETIYLQVSAEEISLEDLNPDWNNEEFKLVE